MIYIVLRAKSLKCRTHTERLQAESLYEAQHGKLCLRMACMAGPFLFRLHATSGRRASAGSGRSHCVELQRRTALVKRDSFSSRTSFVRLILRASN